jgi:hypothetical protein
MGLAVAPPVEGNLGWRPRPGFQERIPDQADRRLTDTPDIWPLAAPGGEAPRDTVRACNPQDRGPESKHPRPARGRHKPTGFPCWSGPTPKVEWPPGSGVQAGRCLHPAC